MNNNEKAKELLQAAIALVGEEEVGKLLTDIGDACLRTALSRLHSSAWWITTLKDAIESPRVYDSQLLCKLLDKAVPTPQAIKVGFEEGFKLIVEHREEGKEKIGNSK